MFRGSGNVVAAHRDEELNMNPLWTTVVGVVTGLIAKLLISGSGPGGYLIKPLVGVAGAFAAAWAAPMLGLTVNGDHTQGLLAPALGAAVFLIVQHLFTKTGRQ